jgi:hypothetical protein
METIKSNQIKSIDIDLVCKSKIQNLQKALKALMCEKHPFNMTSYPFVQPHMKVTADGKMQVFERKKTVHEF